LLPLFTQKQYFSTVSNQFTLLFRKTHSPMRDLAKYVMIAMSAALFCGVSAAIGVYQAKQRGHQYYLDQFDGPMFNENVKKYFLYACDIVSYFRILLGSVVLEF
jgi:hypothetical protein